MSGVLLVMKSLCHVLGSDHQWVFKSSNQENFIASKLALWLQFQNGAPDQTPLSPIFAQLGKVHAPKKGQWDSSVCEFRPLYRGQVTYKALYFQTGFGVGTAEPDSSSIIHRWREFHLSSISLIQFSRAYFTFYTFLWYHRTLYSCWQMEWIVYQN